MRKVVGGLLTLMMLGLGFAVLAQTLTLTLSWLAESPDPNEYSDIDNRHRDYIYGGAMTPLNTVLWTRLDFNWVTSNTIPVDLSEDERKLRMLENLEDDQQYVHYTDNDNALNWARGFRRIVRQAPDPTEQARRLDLVVSGELWDNDCTKITFKYRFVERVGVFRYKVTVDDVTDGRTGEITFRTGARGYLHADLSQDDSDVFGKHHQITTMTLFKGHGNPDIFSYESKLEIPSGGAPTGSGGISVGFPPSIAVSGSVNVNPNGQSVSITVAHDQVSERKLPFGTGLESSFEVSFATNNELIHSGTAECRLWHDAGTWFNWEDDNCTFFFGMYTQFSDIHPVRAIQTQDYGIDANAVHNEFWKK